MAKKKKERSIGKAFGTMVSVAFLVGLCALGALIITVEQGVFGPLPTKQDLANIRNAEASLVLAADGTIIGKIFAKDRTNIRADELPEHVVHALVSTEDARFFEHEGVDGTSYLRVFFRTLLGGDGSSGGGSTISQQLIKNLYGRSRHGPLTIPVNKVKEALVAYRLEQVYDKKDVLVLYLNSVPFGENVYGIEAAARRFFGKGTATLSVEEGAVLIGMLQANTAFNPRLHPEAAMQRRNSVIRRMVDHGHLSAEMAEALSKKPIALRYTGTDALDLYGYFADRVEEEARTILAALKKDNGEAFDLHTDGLRISTTLDTELQHMAASAAQEQLAAMQPRLDKELRSAKARAQWERGLPKAKQNAKKAPREIHHHGGTRVDTISVVDSLWHYHSMLHAAVLIMEPGSGAIRAYVGGGDHRHLPYDLIRARRQVASTIKPAIYAAALEGGAQPCDYLDNRPRTYPELENWAPQNYDRDTMGGEVPLWYALTRSMNLPTVDLFFRTGMDTLQKTFAGLGLPTEALEHPAVALGAADISLQELVPAYGTFANGGKRLPPHMIERISAADGTVVYQAAQVRAQQVISSSTAATITAMLQRAVNEGTGTPLRTRFALRSDVAGKTGTSQEHSDAWFMAYTPALVIGTWVGAMDPAIHFITSAGTGSQLALPIAGRILAEMERSKDLRKRFLVSFGPSDMVDMDCPTWRKYNGLQRFIDDLTDGKRPARKPKKDYTRPDQPLQPKKEKEGFFEKLFGKKKRKK